MPDNAWPPLEWNDDFGHRYRLSCCPLTTGEIIFDIRCLAHDGQELHTNMPRTAAIAVADRLRQAVRGRPRRKQLT